MSEPSMPSPDTRPSERSGFHNPILHIEELHRLPLLGSRTPPPGTALVFRARSGRLTAPHRGLTAGEMFWRGPRVMYTVDVAPHVFDVSFRLDRPGARRGLDVAVSGCWMVADPVAVVRHRVSDAAHLCLAALAGKVDVADRLDAVPADGAGLLLREALGGTIVLTEGVHLSDLRVRVTEAESMTGEGIVRYLVSDEEDDNPMDPASADSLQLLRETRHVAEEGLRAFTEANGEDALDGPAGTALVRFQELVARLSDMVPSEEGRGDDVWSR